MKFRFLPVLLLLIPHVSVLAQEGYMAGDIFALEFVMGNETVDVANSRLVRVIEEEGRIYMAFHFGAIPDRIISKIFGMVFRASSG